MECRLEVFSVELKGQTVFITKNKSTNFPFSLMVKVTIQVLKVNEKHPPVKGEVTEMPKNYIHPASTVKGPLTIVDGGLLSLCSCVADTRRYLSTTYMDG